ncbi:DNA (cytosine-5-)-methyltransferase [Gryllotalpicola koreensis]|uniref:Cytosine-specific methyltransferase n=1 Tax=Gryllotalpicola koreensis TaxID=993086 RepID=A0ABP7ZT73_9MICO
MSALSVVEICAGAGGQALGLELAGFEHRLAVELDENAAATLRFNRPEWEVRVGDVADSSVWNPSEYADELSLLAGGVPCPPFSIAGKQLGTGDERDLFAWAVELAGKMQPRAVLLENVRGLSMPRFAAYRQHVKDRLAELGYWSDWKLLEARDFGVPQLRPRFILVALRSEDARYFSWPKPTPFIGTVGSALADLMGERGWRGVSAWAKRASGIAPTIVGGSKKHGGADLGPTRARKAWAALGVDGIGVADEAPGPDIPEAFTPKLTTEMIARIQGWGASPEYAWTFTGRKTTRARQIGNAFPPPVARAVGGAIAAALRHEGAGSECVETEESTAHDPVYLALKGSAEPMTAQQVIRAAGGTMSEPEFARRMADIGRDFELDVVGEGSERTYAIGAFRGFVGQENHVRHAAFNVARSKIS